MAEKLNLNAMSSKQIRDLQSKLRAAGFDVAVDGAKGPSTAAAYDKWHLQEQGSERALTEAATNKTAAEGSKLAAEAALLAAQIAAAKQKDEADPWEQAKHIGLQVAPAVAGYAGGSMYAKKIGKSFEGKQLQNNKSLSDLAANINKELSRKGGPRTLPLYGQARAGRALGLNKTKGPLAGLFAGAMLAEGALGRGAGYMSEPGWMKDTANGLGTGFGVAGGTVLAQRALRRGLEGVNPDPNDLAALFEAESRLDPQLRAGSVADPVRPGATRARARHKPAAQPAQLKLNLRRVGGAKVLMPLMAVIAASAAARDARASGQDGMGQAGAAAGAGVDVASMGATGAYGRAREAGYGVPGSVAAGAGAAVDNLTTGGMAQTMLDPEVDPEFKRTASANMALPTGSPLNASAAMGVDADAIRKALAYLLSGPAPR